MTTGPTTESPSQRRPELAGQTVVVIGDSAGMSSGGVRAPRCRPALTGASYDIDGDQQLVS
jgi:hypothetical protein